MIQLKMDIIQYNFMEVFGIYILGVFLAYFIFLKLIKNLFSNLEIIDYVLGFLISLYSWLTVIVLIPFLIEMFKKNDSIN